MNKAGFSFIIAMVSFLLVSCVHSSKNGSSVDGRDSLYTWNHIVKIHMKAPRRALALIDTAIMRKTLPEYQGDDLRAIIYKNVLNDLPKAMEYWQRIYQLDSIRKDSKRYLIILSRMTDGAYSMGNYAECIQYAAEGLKVARSLGKQGTEGNLLFTMGESMMRLGQKESAWEYMNRGTGLLEGVSNPKIMPSLSYCYGQQMEYCIDGGDFAGAIAIGERRIGLIKRMEQEVSYPVGYVDRQYGYLYSKMAYCHVMSGRKRQAEEYVKQFLQTTFSHQPEGKRELFAYYLETAQYKKLVRNYNEIIESLPQDTINEDFWIDLNNVARAYEKLGDTKAALHLQRRIGVIRDSLNQRERRGEALKLTIAYRTHEKDLLLKKTRVESQRNLLVAAFMCVLFIVVCVVAYLFYKHSRITLRKNRMLVKQMDDLEDCHAQLEEAYEKIRVMSIGVEMPEEQKKTQEKEENINAQLFKRLEEMMKKEQLFLMKDLTREMVMQRLRIDKNRLSQIFQENAEGVGLPTYINNFRLKWAVCLLKEHPEFTIQAISDASGFSSIRSFQRSFKEKMKMTPAEYRAAITKYK